MHLEKIIHFTLALERRNVDLVAHRGRQNIRQTVCHTDIFAVFCHDVFMTQDKFLTVPSSHKCTVLSVSRLHLRRLKAIMSAQIL